MEFNGKVYCKRRRRAAPPGPTGAANGKDDLESHEESEDVGVAEGEEAAPEHRHYRVVLPGLEGRLTV